MNIRYFSGLGLILLAAVSAFVVLTTRQGAQNKPQQKDEPTVVQRGALTEKQLRHSQEFEDREIPGIRANSSGNIGVYIDIEPGPLPDKSSPRNATEYLRSLTCSGITDAVVVGTVSRKASQLTANGHFVFTDYDLELGDVLKSRKGLGLTVGSSITVTDPGGAVNLDGRVIFVKINRENPLKVGHQYILFLRQLKNADSYRLIGERGIFAIAPGKVKPTYYHFQEGLSASNIIEELRSITPTCLPGK
jgi:hypothetical protein